MSLLRCLLLAIFLIVSSGLAQAESKVYRGAIGDKHIEMQLNIDGSKVTGSYFYDQFKQDIPLEGSYDTKGQLELTEGKGKQKTGKFLCKPEPETFEADVECEWSRPDGKGQAFVVLTEQGIRLQKETKIVPTIVNDRKTKVFASYPQVTAQVMTEGMKSFNVLVESLMQKAVKEFQPESLAKSNFDTNYNVLLANDEVISVEMEEYSDVGGAHPNTRLWTVNFNVKTNKPLVLDDVFLPQSEYAVEIAKFATKDINRRADQIEIDEAKRENRQPQKRDQPVMSEDGLPEMDTWGLSTKGFVVYFDFPHVMAVFDKTVVPYGLLARYLNPKGVVPLVR